MNAGSYVVEIYDGGGEVLALERAPGALATRVLSGDGEIEFGSFLDEHMSAREREHTARSIAAAWRNGFQHGRAAGVGDLQRRLARTLGLATRAELDQLRETIARMTEGGR
jgi:hypothetical protein